MTLPHPIEIYELILEEYVADLSLADDFDQRASPFGESLPLYPSYRRDLATICTLVSREFYDIVLPIAWQYLTVRTEATVNSILRTIRKGSTRRPRMPIQHFVKRLDIRGWRRINIERSMELLAYFPELKVLALECRAYPGPIWRHPSNHLFIQSIPTLCPALRRLQFLDPREAPNLQEVAHLSQKCTELRALQVVHLTERFRPYIYTPTESDFEEDSEEDSDQSGSDGGGVNSEIDWIETEIVEGEEGNNAGGSGEGCSYHEAGANSHGNEEDEDERGDDEGLHFGFQKLKYLSLGMGSIHALVSERRGIARLVEAMAPYRENMKKLQRIDLNIPLDDVKRPLSKFREEVQLSVLHMHYRAVPRAYALFPGIRTLLVVVHTAYISVPLNMNRLEEVEIVLRRPLVGGRVQIGLRIARRILRTAQSLLDMLLRGQYPSLRRVVLWKGAPIHHVGVDDLLSRYKRRFGANGVDLCIREKGALYDHGLSDDDAVNDGYLHLV